MVGDLTNCQRFVRCFHNLRVLFTCAAGTAYVPEMKTCVEKEQVKNCDDPKDRIGKPRARRERTTIIVSFVEVIISANATDSSEEYPTIEADANALDLSAPKGVATKNSAANTPKQFGCQSYCQNQGVCVIVAQSVSCRCPTGYTGLQCQVARKFESTKRSSRCTCICLPPTKEFLIATKDGCDPNPCDNGGTCKVVRLNTISCTCPPGFVGSLCSYSGNVSRASE